MQDPNRRTFNKLLGAGVVAIPVSALLTSFPVRSKDGLPLVDPESAVAKGLSYKVDTEIEGSNCESCVLYVAGDSQEKGICPLFQGESVGANAWCSAYVPRT